MQRNAITQAALVCLAIFTMTQPIWAAQCQRFDLSVVADGTPLEEYAWRGRTYVEALRGRPFSLRISNPTSQRVAVALSVDGRNVIDAKRTTARGATKWILWPGQTIDIPGWQVSGETARKFFFTQTEHSYAKWLGDTSNVGTIEAVFYRERHPEPPIALERPRMQAPMGPSPREKAEDSVEGQAGSPAPAWDQEASVAQESPKARQAPSPDAIIGGHDRDEKDSFAATGIGQRTYFPVERVSFEEDPTPAARITLRYEFRRELVRLGVFPHNDDLAVREHGRGFSPEYAPDPDRPRAQ